MDCEKTNILIVDDLPEKILVYRTILESLDQNIIAARSGEEALRQVLQQEFAVVLLDVHMPGIDGFETAGLIRQRKESAHTPIIFITAFADELGMNQGYATGAVDFILAPVMPDILRAKVKVFVDLYRMTQQVKRQADERVALAAERHRREAAEDANRRLRFLLAPAPRMGQSLDFESSVREVARLSVPYLADMAAVALVEEPNREWQFTLAEFDGSETSLKKLAGREHLPDHFCVALANSIARQRTRFSTPMVARRSRKPSCFPLQVRGRSFAALVLSRGSIGQDV